MGVPTILVIDHDKLIRWSVSAVLGRAGYRVHEAATGKDALAAVQDGAPDLILLDVDLPDMDGFTVLNQIRARHPDLPVLMMTVDATTEMRRQALRLGVRDHLDKPCDPALLKAVVAQALQTATPPSQPAG